MQRNAWLLTLSNQQTLAIAQQQVVEYLSHIDAVQVPDCHPRCDQVLLWRDHVLPILGAAGGQPHHSHLLVAAYVRNLNGRNHAERIALALAEPPAAIRVEDDCQCDPTADQLAYWQDAIRACFLHDGQPVAIVDFASIGATDANRHDELLLAS